MFLHQTSDLVLKEQLGLHHSWIRYFCFACCAHAFYKSHPLKKTLSHVDGIRSIHCKYSSVLFSISAWATAMATTEFTTSSFLLKIIRKFFTFSLSGRSIRGRPRFIFGSTVLLLFDLTNFSYFFLKLLAVLSPSLGWDLLNILATALAPWMELYFPISCRSIS